MRGGDDIIVLSSYNTPLSRKHFLNREATLRRGINENRDIADSKVVIPNKTQSSIWENNVSNSGTSVLEYAPPQVVHNSYYYDTPPQWLGQPFLDEAAYLKEINEKAYRHEYLGEATGDGGCVFENISIRTDGINGDELKEIVESGRCYYGVDWGYYPDPWAYVKCCYIAKERRLYIIDEVLAHKKSNQETADILLNEKRLTREDMIICDNSEPKSVADYISCGLYARGAEKGVGSVGYSMKWLQGLNEIVIDAKKCPNAAREFSEYEYEKDTDGEVISGYPDKNNHLIDAVRYAANLLWRSCGRHPREPM